ncbi:MAG TPA: metal ABC transporter substrate-binding protein [Actinomycetota bacterium]
MRTILILCLVAPLASCAPGSPDEGGELVVATTTILGDVTREVAGDEARVEVLMPPGADPHEFEASAQQVALLHDADLVVANGLGLEETLADALQAARDDEGNVLEVAPELDPLPLEGGGLDPHVWMDPNRVARAAELIAARLDELVPGGWEGRAAAYASELRELDEEIRALLAPIPAEDRELVTNHDAFGYLADRYDLEVVGVVIPGGSTLGEPSAASLAALAEIIRERDVPAIFTETIHSTGLAEVLGDEVGRPVEIVSLYSDSLGEPGSEAATYAGLMRANATRIAEALS